MTASRWSWAAMALATMVISTELAGAHLQGSFESIARARSLETMRQEMPPLERATQRELIDALAFIPQEGRATVLYAVASSILRKQQASARNDATDDLTTALRDPARRGNALYVVDVLAQRAAIRNTPELRAEIHSVVANPTADLEDRIRAVTLTAALAVEPGDNGSRFERDLACERYRTAIRNLQGDPELVRAFAKVAVELQCDGMAEVLRSVLVRNAGPEWAPAIRASIKGLADLGDTGSTELIAAALDSDDEYIHATAAMALARVGGKEALPILLGREARFGATYVSAAIPLMAGDVLDAIRSQAVEADLIVAVNASKYLFADEHLSALRTKLLVLITSDPRPSVVAATLGRLIPILDRAETAEVVNLVPVAMRSGREYEELATIARSTPLATFPSNIAVEPLGTRPHDASPTATRPVGATGNSDAQEYGDPGYRHNAFSWAGLDDRGHTGLMAGVDSGHTLRIIEVNGTSAVVKHNWWSSMKEDPQYWGANTLNNSQYYMTFARRKAVMATAVQLVGADIGYPVLPTPDLLRHVSSPGTSISPSELTHLRCDGLVEYVYEYNGYSVWGKNGANYNVSVTSNVASHNDFYDWPYDPNTETAPVVQAGMAGGTSTRMNWAAQVDVPSISVSSSASGSTVTLVITATDRSGIHHIGTRIGNGTWTYSPAQPQHPTTDSYTWQFPVTTTSGVTVYYVAVDGGGNYATGETWVAPAPPLNAPTAISPGQPIGSNHPPISPSNIQFQWNKHNTGATYELYVRDITGYADDVSTAYGILVLDGLNVGDTNSYTWNGASSGKKYRWQVEANKSGSTPVLSDRLVFVTSTPDVQNPSITITGPTSGSTHSTTSTPITLSGSSSDNVGVTQVTCSNTTTGSNVTANGTTSWSCFVSLAQGSNSITVTARDAANNTASDSLTVTYSPPDTVAPTVTITSPTSSTTYTTGSTLVALGGSASDNVAVTQVTCTNGATGQTVTAIGTSGWSCNVPLVAGSNTITVRAYDAAGNPPGTDAVTVTFTPSDFTVPSILITTPTSSSTYSTSSTPLTVGGTTSDNVGVTQVTCTNAATGSTVAATGTSNWSCTVVLASGGNTITATARDAAGNSSSATLTVTYTSGNSLPTLTSLSPASVTAGSGAFTLTVDGSGFLLSSAVLWNGAPKPTSYVSSTRLAATIDASDIVTPGSASLTVVNPAPGGGTSNALTFSIQPSSCSTIAIGACPYSANRSLATSSCAGGQQGSGFYYDLFSFTGTQGTNIIIDLKSLSFDTYLFLIAPDGSVAASNDDWNGTDSRIEVTLGQTGSWSIQATTYYEGATGAYSLVVTGCSSNLTAPTNLSVTYNHQLYQGNPGVNLSWTGVANAVAYEADVNGSLLYFATTNTSVGVYGLAEPVCYVVRVRAIGVSGQQSAWSARGIATSIVFSDDPLVSGSTPIRAAHLNELRAAVATVRSAAGLPAPSFTDTLAPGVPIRAVHPAELLDYLNQALGTLEMPGVSMSAPIAGVTLIQAVHVQRLRDAMK